MTKRRSIISLVIIFILIGVFGYWGIFGAQIGKYDLVTLGDKIQQGLDLRGGVYAVFEADKPDDMGNDEFKAKLSAAIDILRTRLDGQGYTEATIAIENNDRLRIEIPEVDDATEVLSIIGKPALLQFVDPEGNVILEGDQVEYARAGYLDGSGNRPIVNLEFNSEGTSAFADATTEYVGQEISILLDGEVISDPIVNEPILGGTCYINYTSGDVTINDAIELAMLIESGALPLEFEQLEARTISATLGVNALDSSLLAGLVGIIALFIFLILFYRLSGLIADITLTIYLLIVVYIIAIAGVQLTLPGIAGIILGVGMAVDANVIIFERIKEEVRTGKTFRSAADAGFKKAIWTILDANITTLIAAVVLMFFGTGTIKGFAYTLAIGIGVSVFTALVISRWLIKCLIGLNIKNTKVYFSGTDPEKLSKVRSIKVMKNSKIFAAISGIIIAAGLVILIISVASGGTGFNLGVDFTGGTILTVDVGQEFEATEVESIVEQYADDYSVAVSEDTKAVIKLQIKEGAGDSNTVNAMIIDELAEIYPAAAWESEDTVGGTASNELTRNAFISVLIACAAMLVYIWFRFELLSGVAALVALVHDVAIMSAVVLILGVQVNSAFIAAVLTIVGYSINDTIVVFDRIRENGRRMKGSLRGMLVDKSISETIVRSLNTSITTLFTITALYIFGVTSIKEFALPLIVGILSGTYSSIFIAAPFWVWIHKLDDNRKKKYKA